LSQPGDLDAKKLKNYLRCAEGMDIIIEPDLRHLRRKVLALTNPYAEAAVLDQDFCICKTKDINPTTCCVKCDKTFHLSCVGLNEETMLDYICESCQVKLAPKPAPASNKSKIIIKLGKGGSSNSVTAILPQVQIIAPEVPAESPHNSPPGIRPQRRAATKPPDFYSLNSKDDKPEKAEKVEKQAETSNNPPKKRQKKSNVPKIDPIMQEQLLLMQQYNQSTELYVDDAVMDDALPPAPPSMLPPPPSFPENQYGFQPNNQMYQQQPPVDFYYGASPFAVFNENQIPEAPYPEQEPQEQPQDATKQQGYYQSGYF
jgi:hypothetical protein